MTSFMIAPPLRWSNKYEPATTFWELPDGDSEGPGMNSRNHHMFAYVVERLIFLDVES